MQLFFAFGVVYERAAILFYNEDKARTDLRGEGSARDELFQFCPRYVYLSLKSLHFIPRFLYL